jgi:predicted dehydrogenase
MLDHTYCYTPAVAHLRELVRGGGIGAVQYVDSVRINLGIVQSDVDVLWDLAPHDLSIFFSVLPEDVVPVSVAAHGSDPIGAGRVCVAHLTLVLSNGAIAHVHVNWLSPTKIRTMVIGGSTHTVVWDDLNPSQRLSIYDRGVDTTATAEDSRTRALVSYRLGDMVAPALPEREALREVMAEFASAITQGRRPLTDGWSGIRVLAVLEAASASLKHGGAAMPVIGIPELQQEGISA